MELVDSCSRGPHSKSLATPAGRHLKPLLHVRSTADARRADGNIPRSVRSDSGRRRPRVAPGDYFGLIATLEARQKAPEALFRPPSPFASCDSCHCVARSVVMNWKGRTGLGG
jgi:hypothetical protein